MNKLETLLAEIKARLHKEAVKQDPFTIFAIKRPRNPPRDPPRNPPRNPPRSLRGNHLCAGSAYDS